MESIQINLTDQTVDKKELNIGVITYADNSFIVEILDNSYLNLNVGQTIYYERKLYKGNGEYEIITDSAEIIDIINGDDENNAKIIITLPPKEIYEIVSSSMTADKNILLQLDKKHKIFQQDIESFSGSTMYLYDRNYNFLASLSNSQFGVPVKYSNELMNIHDCLNKTDEYTTCEQNGCEKIDVYEYVFIPDIIIRNKILILNDVFSECLDENGVISSGEGICNKIQEAKYITFKFNPFFYQDENGIHTYEDDWRDELDIIEDNGLLVDVINWQGICGGETADNEQEEERRNKCIEITSQDNETSLVVYDNAYKINLGLSSDAENLSLGAEDSYGESFIDNIIEESIPEIIDMERIKYSPGFIKGSSVAKNYYVWYSPEGNTCGLKNIFTSGIGFTNNQIITNESDEIKSFYRIDANGNISGLTLDDNTYFKFHYEYGSHFKNGVMPTLYKQGAENCKYYLSDEKIDQSFIDAERIIFYLHFLKREEISDDERTAMNTIYTSGNVYYDTWHIDSDARDVTWWNGFDYSGTTFDLSKFNDFYHIVGHKSDLMGYLNFTDKDIYYRKKKVSESFLRLSFYTSKDPYSQKLLYYSTIFLDDNELYGKYISALNNPDFKVAKDKNKITKRVNENAFAVLYSGDTKIDSAIVVTNEYDRTKSSEGFNIYLFAEDKTFEAENGEKTIYMKVEFNHAGNGKTIPLIIWPKDNEGRFCALTTDNFIDALYIPVKLSYINGRYVYNIIGSENSDNKMLLKLFEPKLDALHDVDLSLE